MTTTYTYNQTNRNLTFNLASNISITQQLAENTTFTLSNGFFLREADSEALPGADNQISFAISVPSVISVANSYLRARNFHCPKHSSLL